MSDTTKIGEKITNGISEYTGLVEEILGAVGPAATALKEAFGPALASLKDAWEGIVAAAKSKDLLDGVEHAALKAQLAAKYDELERS